MLLVGFATLGHSAIFLGVQQGGASSSYMVALLLLLALILAVLLFRERLAVGIPWLHVLRRADMKKQEAQIIEAAVELELQLTRAQVSDPAKQPQQSREVSSVNDAPHHLLRRVASSIRRAADLGTSGPGRGRQGSSGHFRHCKSAGRAREVNSCTHHAHTTAGAWISARTRRCRCRAQAR